MFYHIIALTISNTDILPATFPFTVGEEQAVQNIELYIEYDCNTGDIQTDCCSFRQGDWTYSAYGKDGNKLTDEDGTNVTEYFYENGKVVKQTLTDKYNRKYSAYFAYDGKGNKTAYGYNNGELASVSGNTDGEESTNTMQYTAGMLTKASNGDTDYNYTYDGWGRITKAEIAGNVYCETEYASDLQTNVTFADGTQRSAVTDKYGKVTQQTTTFANGIIETVTNTYDDLQNLKSTAIDTSDGKGYNIEYKYNEIGKVSKETRVKDGVRTDFKTYSYTTDKILESAEYNVGGQTLTYGYDTDTTPTKRNSKINLPFDVEQKFSYDGLGRTKEISLSENLVKDIYYAKYGDHATNRVNSVWYGINGIRKDNVKYTYDKAGNVETISENGKLVAKYTYDGLNRLIQEDSSVFGKISYRYDHTGNILCKTVNGAEHNYSYSQHGWKDQLLSYNNEQFAYDALGNPTTYRDRTLSWQGRRLLSYSKDNKSANFTYDVNGIRTGKVIKNGEQIVSQTEYVYDGNSLIAEQRNGEWIYYIYGADGIAGFRYNGITYLYRKNLQGDITHIYKQELDSTLTLVAQYVYDAWGNCKTITDVDGIATLNPFRYRSYYFDEETGLFYLQTRYYDPELGRFISADSIEYLDPETIGGLNLYAYCGNNPVMRVDLNGSDWDSFWKGVGDWFRNAGRWINDNIIQPTASFLKEYGDIILGGLIAIGLLVVSICTFGFATVALGMVVGAVVGASFGAINALASGDNILYGALSGLFVGLLSGIGGPGIGGMLISGIASGFGAAAASLLGDIVNNRSKDYKKAAISSVITAVFAGLGSGAGNKLSNFAEGFSQKLFANYFAGLFASTFIQIGDYFNGLGAKNYGQ